MHFCRIIYIFIVLLLQQNPDDDHGSDRNMLVKGNNM